MDDSSINLPLSLKILESHLTDGKEEVSDFSNRQYNQVRENALVYCLARAIDLTEACLFCSERYLSASLQVIARGILETMIISCWVQLSDENAIEYKDLSGHELKRIVRKNLLAGYASIKHRETGDNVTSAILESDLFSEIPARKRIESLAEESGLGKIYSMFYGFMSMQAHGVDFGIFSKESDKFEDIYSTVALVNSMLDVIRYVVRKWITNRQNTSTKEINSILLTGEIPGG
jgi:hypothetical protein